MGGMQQYVLHVVIQIFIWSFIGQAWSLMGRFGLVSLGHGAFLGVGAYTTTLLWNFYSAHALDRRRGRGGRRGRARRWSRLPVLRASGSSATTSRLVTLAVGEVIRLLIIAERDWTGGSLGVSSRPAGAATGLLDAPVRRQARLLLRVAGLWLAGLWVWDRVDRSHGALGAWRPSARTRRRRPRSAST